MVEKGFKVEERRSFIRDTNTSSVSAVCQVTFRCLEMQQYLDGQGLCFHGMFIPRRENK